MLSYGAGENLVGVFAVPAACAMQVYGGILKMAPSHFVRRQFWKLSYGAELR